MRRPVIILTALLCILNSFALTARPTLFNKEHLNVSVHGRYQHMLDVHKLHDDMLYSFNSALAGVQVGLDTHPVDGSWWANAYNFPSLSLGFSFDNTGALKTKPDTNLGDFYNLYLALNFDFFRLGCFSMGPVLEVGATYCTDRYNSSSNPVNLFVGSNFLANLACGLEAKVRFLPQWEFALTGNLIHHSNGMNCAPNLGTNQAALGGKLKYYLAPQETMRRARMLPPEFKRHFDWNVYTSFGVHSCDWELYADGRETYPVKPRLRALLGVESQWRYCRITSTSLGIEANYADNAHRHTDLRLRGMEDPQGYSPFYTSVHLSQHLHYAAFSAHFTWGVYTFKKTGLVEDIGRCYQKIGARYHLPEFRFGQMFLGFDMRAHYMDRSYCLEYSLGIAF